MSYFEENIHFSSANKSESEEDDMDSFFLQPSPSPYNITEKIKEANEALEVLETKYQKRTTKVTFRENLIVEFDLTDDDVQSIESYVEEIEEEDSTESTLRNISHTGCVVIEEEELDAGIVGEEIVVQADEESLIEIIENKEDLKSTRSSPSSDSNCRVLEKQKTKIIHQEKERNQTFQRKHQSKSINCRNHCIEKIDASYSLLEGRLLQIKEGPSAAAFCPTLRLHRINCCESNYARRNRGHVKLPLYTGHRSEYGLSESEMERLEKRKELIELKRQKERQLREEFERRKNHQNETIFRQWLRNLSAPKKNPSRRVKTRTNSSFQRQSQLSSLAN